MARFYKSQYPGLTMFIREPVYERYADGTKVIVKPALELEFGRFGAAKDPFIEDGMRYQFADFQGGLIDMDELAKEKKAAGVWDDDDIAFIHVRLNEAINNPQSPFYGDVQEFEIPKPDAPWPKYDEMHPSVIAEQAQMLGMVERCLLYEAATHNREEVVGALTALAQQDQELTAA